MSINRLPCIVVKPVISMASVLKGSIIQFVFLSKTNILEMKILECNTFSKLETF